MVTLFQALFSGLALGGIYALVALGFSITHSTTKTLNFGQGEFLVAACFLAATVLLLLAGKPHTGNLQPADVSFARYLLAMVVVIALMAAFGVLLYGAAVRPFAGGGMGWVMSTIGFGIIVQNAALAVWSPAPMAMPSPLGDEVLRFGGAGVRPQEILVLVITAVVVFGQDWLLHRTRVGRAMRAVAANRNAAALMGINVGAIVLLAFAMASGLAGLAGVLIVPITTASIFMGLTLSLKAFSAAILGGLNNPRGCIVGGLVLGCFEALVGLWRAELREISIFVLIILALMFKPEGLFGRKSFEKV
ncbi:MAG: branched-chain amino acid ABC transporter permease [Burkholderiales bacterium]|nr:branched-chain amino acid ABC transporter permease [Burkholderiales bacterium]